MGESVHISTFTRERSAAHGRPKRQLQRDGLPDEDEDVTGSNYEQENT